MKNIIFLIFITLFFTGCVSTQPSVYLKTTHPLIITQKPQGKKVYVKFNNSINIENNITKHLEYELKNNGYDISKDPLNSDYEIYGDLINFQRIYVKDPNIYLSFRPALFYGRFGYFYDYDPYFYNDTSYIYKAQVSVLIKSKNLQTYSTNLNLESSTGVYSTSTIMAKFTDRISKQIVHFLEF